jgi:hypothetical protein
MKCNDTMWLRITKDRLRAELDTMTTVDELKGATI